MLPVCLFACLLACLFVCNSETNLKIRRARQETLHIVSETEASQLQAVIRCEKPNNRLYNFEGTIDMNNNVRVSLDPENVLLRGSSLRNTEWVIGVVVFAGHETKLMMNTKYVCVCDAWNDIVYCAFRITQLTHWLIHVCCYMKSFVA